ncbi:hypothetical protein LEP1GSC166_3624 [Leptospira kirschneri]|nr:hypothetical protein LEP1GSC166_3624 [Leptospira kirschneri]
MKTYFKILKNNKNDTFIIRTYKNNRVAEKLILHLFPLHY